MFVGASEGLTLSVKFIEGPTWKKKREEKTGIMEKHKMQVS